MKPENKQFLEDNYHHWITLRDAQFLRGLNANEREGMMRVMSEEFQPGYTCDLWCNSCVVGMVTRLFTLYDQWKAEQPIVVAAAFPLNEQPKNKHHHRK